MLSKIIRALTVCQLFAGALRTMIRQEGWSRPVRGVSAVFVGAGPAHAMYFAGYEKIKRELTIRLTKGKPGESPLANALAGEPS